MPNISIEGDIKVILFSDKGFNEFVKKSCFLLYGRNNLTYFKSIVYFPIVQMSGSPNGWRKSLFLVTDRSNKDNYTTRTRIRTRVINAESASMKAGRMAEKELELCL